MKPTKNRYFCFGAKRNKMLFETESKANNFIKFNAKEFEEEGNKAPTRSYFCTFCNGWHVTSNSSTEIGERLDRRDQEKLKIIKDYIESKDKKSFAHYYGNRINSIIVLINQGMFDEAEDQIDILDIYLDDYVRDTKSLKKCNDAKARMKALHSHYDTTHNVFNMSDEELENTLQDINSSPKIKKLVSITKAIRYLNNILNTINEINDVKEYNETLSMCWNYINSIKGPGFKDIRNDFIHRFQQLHKR